MRDTGIGIAADDLDRIFESFSQVDTTDTRRYGGTGLGLAISRQLVQMMGGELSVHSEIGRGSNFAFTLHLPAAASLSTPEQTKELVGVRILAVDDNATNREILDQQLLGWGTSYYIASGGEEAYRVLREAYAMQNPFALVILDQQMPQVTGTQLAARIRADAELKDTRLVLLSSMAHISEHDNPQSVGIDTFLNKPARQAELYQCLVTTLGGSPAPATPQPAKPTLSLQNHAEKQLRGNILLTEDNPINQELAQAILADLGLDVTLAVNGQEALAALMKQPEHFDLVLMDCQMPVMDGFEATREIRRAEQARGAKRPIPIVALTANAMEGDREKCLATGMSDYLTKPFAKQDLLQILSSWLPAQASVPVRPPQTPSVTAMPAFTPAEVQQASLIPSIDTQALTKIRSLQRPGQPNILSKIVRLFLTTSPKTMEDLETGLATDNRDLIRDAAHGLKSSAGNLGARKLSELCRMLEQKARTGELDQAQNYIAELRLCYGQCRDALERLLIEEEQAHSGSPETLSNPAEQAVRERLLQLDQTLGSAQDTLGELANLSNDNLHHGEHTLTMQEQLVADLDRILGSAQGVLVSSRHNLGTAEQLSLVMASLQSVHNTMADLSQQVQRLTAIEQTDSVASSTARIEEKTERSSERRKSNRPFQKQKPQSRDNQEQATGSTDRHKHTHR